jgi:integrase/recombinase XerD
MNDYIEEFKLYMKMDNNSENTVKNYVPDVEKMLDFINKDPLQLNKMDIVNYTNMLQDKEFNAKTINRKLYAVYKFVQFLSSKYSVNIDFKIKKMKMRIEKQEYTRNALTKTDFKRVLHAAFNDNNIMFYTLLMTLYYTGMRISEALDIKVKDTNKKEILVVGKDRKQRYVFFPDELKKQFKKYIAERDSKKEYLFINREKDTRLTEWMADYWFKKYASKTKVELKKAHCHNVRHLFCYICLNERGMKIDEVAQLAGHSNINTTMIYTKKTKKELLNDVKDFKIE